MTLAANTPERDAALRDLAGRFSIVAGGQPLDISVGAAALFVAAQADMAKNPEFNDYLARKLQQVVDLYKPAWRICADELPPDETPVLIVRCGCVRIGELRWEHPGHEDPWDSFRYWDDPNDDGQAWEFPDVTHWAPLLSAPA